jgi:3-methyladenine DNA glycosylase AlkD
VNYQEAIDLLEQHKDERGIAHFKKAPIAGLKSFGMGLTSIKKLAKGMSKDNELARELWNSEYLEAKHLACLLTDAKKIEREELHEMALNAGHWMLTHSFLQNVMAKAKNQVSISDEWRKSEDDQLRSCGFGMLYYMVKDKKISDDYFMPLVAQIQSQLQSESNFVKDQMNTALFAIGKRSAALHQASLQAAKKIGKVEVDYGDNSCQAMDVVKHLSSERLVEKFSN